MVMFQEELVVLILDLQIQQIQLDNPVLKRLKKQEEEIDLQRQLHIL
jgi:hypothetical protein